METRQIFCWLWNTRTVKAGHISRIPALDNDLCTWIYQIQSIWELRHKQKLGIKTYVIWRSVYVTLLEYLHMFILIVPSFLVLSILFLCQSYDKKSDLWAKHVLLHNNSNGWWVDELMPTRWSVHGIHLAQIQSIPSDSYQRLVQWEIRLYRASISILSYFERFKFSRKYMFFSINS